MIGMFLNMNNQNRIPIQQTSQIIAILILLKYGLQKFEERGQ